MSLTVGTNSYVDVATADAYFADRLFADAWTAAAAAQKSQALIMAAKVIDRQKLVGITRDNGQVMQFPRCFKMNPDVMRYFGNTATPTSWEMMNGFYCETNVSQVVKDAQCEEALAILDRGNSKRRKLQQEGVRSASVGQASETYAPSSGRGGLISLEARELLNGLIVGSVKIT